jgi:hypothetical protein
MLNNKPGRFTKALNALEAELPFRDDSEPFVVEVETSSGRERAGWAAASGLSSGEGCDGKPSEEASLSFSLVAFLLFLDDCWPMEESKPLD